jgi:hypothetical protein
VGHDVGENEKEEQGLHADAEQEGDELAAEDAEVALQEAEESLEEEEFAVGATHADPSQ